VGVAKALEAESVSHGRQPGHFDAAAIATASARASLDSAADRDSLTGDVAGGTARGSGGLSALSQEDDKGIQEDKAVREDEAVREDKAVRENKAVQEDEGAQEEQDATSDGDAQEEGREAEAGQADAGQPAGCAATADKPKKKRNRGGKNRKK
jgi:hypothetical protein